MGYKVGSILPLTHGYVWPVPNEKIAWAEKGIVGRGILVDYHRWRQQQGGSEYANINTFDTTPITLKDLHACLAAQGTQVKFGDILVVRSGEFDATVYLSLNCPYVI